jgi:hypothetical protein
MSNEPPQEVQDTSNRRWEFATATSKVSWVKLWLVECMLQMSLGINASSDLL